MIEAAHVPYIRATLAHPLADSPRLVFADWLEERGDPRGPWLRYGAELRRRALAVPVNVPAPAPDMQSLISLMLRCPAPAAHVGRLVAELTPVTPVVTNPIRVGDYATRDARVAVALAAHDLALAGLLCVDEIRATRDVLRDILVGGGNPRNVAYRSVDLAYAAVNMADGVGSLGAIVHGTEEVTVCARPWLAALAYTLGGAAPPPHWRQGELLVTEAVHAALTG